MPYIAPPYREHYKAMKKSSLLPAVKGLNGMKMSANMHVHGVKPAKSSFGRVRNPSRVEREWKKTLEKFTQNCSI